VTSGEGIAQQRKGKVVQKPTLLLLHGITDNALCWTRVARTLEPEQLGLVVIPKSTNPGRIRENLDVFDFALSQEEMAAISALDTGVRVGADPNTANFA
jgi:hypothetical protein